MESRTGKGARRWGGQDESSVHRHRGERGEEGLMKNGLGHLSLENWTGEKASGRVGPVGQGERATGRGKERMKAESVE